MTYDRYTSIVEELKQSLKELEASQSQHPLIQQYINDEITEVKQALSRVRDNQYGYCELSGQEIPFDYMLMNPTCTTIEAAYEWRRFGKISSYS
ncbi:MULTISPECIES: hypothetical protein [unclassified Rossellomorea]|uniref:hypothetical protein n=1 Tax=unclassified Rossellomorea TaxID=2837526 RepID=UPI0020C68D0A|nr:MULTISPECIES: hypothetical protein [unclassified Rossellomorea]UTE75327.1 hypothetical protein M1J35_11875 [Rossellomorea sp. KS-H15a]WGG47451.1 hypothetical protein P8596_09690 [Rossellomorea sp. DA94]